MGDQPADLREPTQETRCLPVLSSDTSVEERLGSLNDPDRRSDDRPRHLPTSACGQAQAGPSPPCEVASPRSSLRPCSCPEPWRAAGVAPSVAKPSPPYLTLRLFARVCAAAGAPFRQAAAARGGSCARAAPGVAPGCASGPRRQDAGRRGTASFGS